MIACRQLKLQGSQGFDLCHECVMALIRVRVILFLRCFGRGGLRAAARVQLLQQRGKLLGRAVVASQQRFGEVAIQFLRRQTVTFAGRLRGAQAVAFEAALDRAARQGELRGHFRDAPADQNRQPHQAHSAVAVRAQAPEGRGRKRVGCHVRSLLREDHIPAGCPAGLAGRFARWPQGAPVAQGHTCAPFPGDQYGPLLT